MKHVGRQTDVADIASQAQIQALEVEITNLRRAASCNFGGVLSGAYYDNSFGGLTAGNTAWSTGIVAVVPYMTPVAMTIDRFGIVVSTLATAGTVDLQVYESLANGWPGARLLATTTLSTTSVGLKEATVSFTFEAGKNYWLGMRASVAVTVKGIQMACAKQFGMASTDGSTSNYATGLVQNSSMAGAAPSTWGAVTVSQLNSFPPPSFRLRAV